MSDDIRVKENIYTVAHIRRCDKPYELARRFVGTINADQINSVPPLRMMCRKIDATLVKRPWWRFWKRRSYVVRYEFMRAPWFSELYRSEPFAELGVDLTDLARAFYEREIEH